MKFYRGIRESLCKGEIRFRRGLDSEVNGSIVRRRGEGGEKGEKKRERESNRPHALLPHTRANPFVFGILGKAVRVKGRPVSNSRLGREVWDV